MPIQCVYPCTHTHTLKHTYIHTYSNTHIQSLTHRHTDTDIHAHTRKYTQNIHRQAYTRNYIYIYVCISRPGFSEAHAEGGGAGGGTQGAAYLDAFAAFRDEVRLPVCVHARGVVCLCVCMCVYAGAYMHTCEQSRGRVRAFMCVFVY